MKDLAECRAEIDRVDRELLRLFEERMEICQEVAQYKAAHGLATYDPGREQAVLDGLAEKTTPELLPYAQKLWQTLMDLSKDFQRRGAAVTPSPAARRAAAVEPSPAARRAAAVGPYPAALPPYLLQRFQRVPGVLGCFLGCFCSIMN